MKKNVGTIDRVLRVVVGAGLPLDLPDLGRDFPQVALIPILSDARGVALVVKKWERKQRLPDAIVIEHPRWAGGHLGAAKIEDLTDSRFDFENVVPQTLASSTIAVMYSKYVNPAPPYSSGTSTPIRPSSPIFSKSSLGKCCSSSQVMTFGRIWVSAN